MSNIDFTPGGVGCIAWLDDVRHRQERYAQSMSFLEWSPDMLSDMGHLGLVDVPRLLATVEEKRNTQGENGNPDSDPRSDGIGLSKSPLKFVLKEKSVTKPILLVQAGNRPANLFVRLAAKFIGASIHVVGYQSSNETKISHRANYEWRS